MTLKKRILIAALALGTVLGFGSGFLHLHLMYHRCRQDVENRWFEHHPCGQGGPRWHQDGLGEQWSAPDTPPPAPPVAPAP